MFVETTIFLEYWWESLAYKSTMCLNISFFLNHKILHSCPLNICTTYCILNRDTCPPTFQAILILQVQIYVRENSLRRQYNGI